MLGKAKWFTPRKFGWGLGIGTKESIFYIAAIVIILAIISQLPLQFEIKAVVSGIIIAVFVLDTLHMMMEVYKRLDEREQKHQAIAERNASFIAIIGLIVFLAFESVATYPVAPSFDKIAAPVGILVAMSLAKGISLLYLERNG